MSKVYLTTHVKAPKESEAEIHHSALALGEAYLTERAKWKKAGKPKRTAEEMMEIFDKHCSGCEHFKKKDETSGSCNICGCNIKRDSTFMNKLYYGTTACPDEPPKWEAKAKPVHRGFGSPPKEGSEDKSGGCGCGGNKK